MNVDFKEIKDSMITVGDIQEETTLDKIVFGILSGTTVVLVDGYNKGLVVDTREFVGRNIGEPTLEPTVKGPKEGFVEKLNDNLCLIRMKIRDPNLSLDIHTVGKRTKTDIVVAYIRGIANPKIIDEVKYDKLACPQRVLEHVTENYNNTEVYKALIDELCCFIMEKFDLSEVDCISGGERRDWFFSLITAKMLAKPHLTIYKDQSAVISDENGTREIDNVNGMKILHIADLVTEASSYERAWIPAVRNINGEMKWSVSIVDRNQGGAQLLERNGVEPYSMIYVDYNF